MLDDWQEWIAIGAMTLVGAFGVTAAIMAVGTRNGDMLSAIGADVARCEADLAQVKEGADRRPGLDRAARCDRSAPLPHAVPGGSWRSRAETSGGRADHRFIEDRFSQAQAGKSRGDQTARAGQEVSGTSGSEAEAGGESPGETSTRPRVLVLMAPARRARTVVAFGVGALVAADRGDRCGAIAVLGDWPLVVTPIDEPA
jgi:hypothetical protein